MIIRQQKEMITTEARRHGRTLEISSMTILISEMA
jgi:hypothetical protein